MGKQIKNDQEPILQALADENYMFVWNKVAYIGYKIIPDNNDRFMLFWSIVKQFKYKENNNFILFYSNRLKYYKASKNETFFAPASRGVISKLKREYISPTECEESRIAKALKNWNNY